MSNYKSQGTSGLSALYRRYKSKAKYRGYKFSLTKQKFAEITSSNCFYCGAKPSQISYEDCKNKEHSAYKYNGIDRLNNKIGYIKGNVVACCRIHNEWKRAMPVKQFIDLIHKTSKHLSKYEKKKA